MQLTIQDILQLFPHGTITVLAGKKRLGNSITSVNILDAPDVLNWVKPGEMILTTAYILKDNEALQESIIRNLKKAEASALGIKTQRFLRIVPEIILKTADEVGLPILNLPSDYSLTEIMHPIFGHIINRQSYNLSYTIEVQEKFSNALLEGKGFPSIIDKLATLTNAPAACYDKEGNLLYHAVPFSEGIVLQQVSPPHLQSTMQQKFFQNHAFLDAIAQSKAPHFEEIQIGGHISYVMLAPLLAQNEFFGYVAIFPSTKSFLAINGVALKQASPFIVQDFVKQLAVRSAQNARNINLLARLFGGDALDRELLLSIRTAYPILAGKKNFCCWAIQIDDTKDYHLPILLSRLERSAGEFLQFIGETALLSEQPGKVIVLLIGFKSETELIALARDLHASLTKTFSNLKISLGAGLRVEELHEIARSCYVAETTLRLGRDLLGEGRVTTPYEIISYAILETSEASHMLTELYSPLLQRLQSAGEEYIETLYVYLETEQRASETAAKLYIHRNTLTNRLEKIRALTGMDFKDKETLIGLRLALRRYRMEKEGFAKNAAKPQSFAAGT